MRAELSEVQLREMATNFAKQFADWPTEFMLFDGINRIPVADLADDLSRFNERGKRYLRYRLNLGN